MKKERKPLVGRMPRLSSAKHQKRAAQAQEPEKRPAVPNPLPAPDMDILAPVVKKHEIATAKMACTHNNLRFGSMGADITCIDCPARWRKMCDGADLVPDLGYFHPSLNETVTRHSLFEAPRLAPLAVPAKPKK